MICQRKKIHYTYIDCKNHPQVYLEKCKYRTKKKQMNRFTNTELKSVSDSESSDSDSDSGSSDSDSDSESSDSDSESSDSDSDSDLGTLCFSYSVFS